MFLVHLDVLVGQTYEKMKSFGLHCGFIKAGWEENREAPIQIASIQTMAKRRWWKQWPADVVFYDEGHITLFSQVGKSVLKTFPNAVHLVMTATPERLGKEQLGDYMDTLVASPVPSDLQHMGYLAPMKYYSMPPDGVANLKDVKTVGGDYDEAGLKNACDRPELIEKLSPNGSASVRQAHHCLLCRSGTRPPCGQRLWCRWHPCRHRGGGHPD
jgi:hypothetical protein